MMIERLTNKRSSKDEMWDVLEVCEDHSSSDEQWK